MKYRQQTYKTGLQGEVNDVLNSLNRKNSEAQTDLH